MIISFFSKETAVGRAVRTGIQVAIATLILAVGVIESTEFRDWVSAVGLAGILPTLATTSALLSALLSWLEKMWKVVFSDQTN